jgi:hypothetical protein
MEVLKCLVNETIEKSFPEFDITLFFENEFFKDTYILETEQKPSNVFKSIKYNVFKNEEFLGSIFLENYNINEFMNKFMNIVDDYDVNRLYDKNIKSTLLENYNKFIENFEKKIIKNQNTFLGEVYKMRKAAGI